MLDRLRTHLPAVVTAAVVSTVLAGGPTVAKAVFDAENADKVDGRHAVSAGAAPGQRAGKLVATADNGRLPNTIIQKAPDAGRLDGLNGTAYARRAQQGMVFSGPIEPGGTLTSTLAEVASVKIKAPADGYLAFTAQANFNAHDATSFVEVWLKANNGEVLRFYHWDAGDADGWFDQTQELTAVVPVEKGRRTYVLELREGSANVYAQYQFARISAEFFPRGSVTPNV